MDLERELKVFEEKLPELLKQHAGKFVLIHEDDVVDFYNAYEDAIRAGYEKFGPTPFLVKKIEVEHRVRFFGRLHGCPTSH